MSLKQDVKDLNRFKEVISVLLKHDFGFLIKKIKLHRDLPLKQRLESGKFEPKRLKPAQLRRAFEELGGIFIKLGQMLSLRPDLIPVEFCEEFSKLQDKIPPFQTDKAIEIIESELNQPIERIFKKFSKNPLAAASIGQVYEATLINGRKVIVKVQRPNISELVKEDLDILKYFSHLLEKNQKLEFLDIPSIITEVERFSECELDFRKEAKNIDLFYKYNFDDKTLIVPKAHLSLSTRKVLVMDFVEGEELKHIPPPNKSITKKIINSILKQIFVDGFFHGDPHPGNIIVKGKKIAFVDFGIMGHIDNELKSHLFALFVATINRNADKMAESLIALNTLKSAPKEKIMEDLSLNFREYYKKGLTSIKFEEVYHKIFEFAREDNIRLPLDFVLFGKTMATLESIARQYDPQFELAKAATPFVTKSLEKEFSPSVIINNLKNNTNQLKKFIKGIPKGTKDFMSQLKSTDQALQNIDKDVATLTVEIDKSSNRVTYAVILASMIIASALLIKEKTYTIAGISTFSLIGFGLAFILAIFITISVIKEKKTKKEGESSLQKR